MFEGNTVPSTSHASVPISHNSPKIAIMPILKMSN